MQASCKGTEMPVNMVSGHKLALLALDTEVKSSQVALASVEGIHVMQGKGQRLLSGIPNVSNHRRECRKWLIGQLGKHPHLLRALGLSFGASVWWREREGIKDNRNGSHESCTQRERESIYKLLENKVREVTRLSINAKTSIFDYQTMFVKVQ
ncbi:hypothetical protein PAXRUDRAFT_324193 [Paxillus rubicundulus Ve08.2h10]|uniref:Uncharacterized protein n=1 Tax=Paxillus rubicundulus Ve08.2h10 TaxID=930991 RepID=A0A0D0E9Z4_9AGAM|nr:hypothetical protein PAXRUDRAFT_324193 [Paxillus rubicundulus Ve08.2h10]